MAKDLFHNTVRTIWLQQNSTEIYIARELIQLGAFPQDIIYGFRSPTVRQRIAEVLYAAQ